MWPLGARSPGQGPATAKTSAEGAARMLQNVMLRIVGKNVREVAGTRPVYEPCGPLGAGVLFCGILGVTEEFQAEIQNDLTYILKESLWLLSSE